MDRSWSRLLSSNSRIRKKLMSIHSPGSDPDLYKVMYQYSEIKLKTDGKSQFFKIWLLLSIVLDPTPFLEFLIKDLKCLTKPGLWICIHIFSDPDPADFPMRIWIQLLLKCGSGSSFTKFVKWRYSLVEKNIKGCSKVRNNRAAQIYFKN